MAGSTDSQRHPRHDAVALGAVRLAVDHVEDELFDTDSVRLAAAFAP